MSANKQEKIKEKLLLAMLKHVPFDGWSDTCIEMAEKDLSLEPGTAQLYFSGGVIEILDYFSTICDEKMLAEIKKLNLKEMKIREKIAQSIIIRLHILEKFKPAMSKTIATLSMPWHLAHATKFVWRTCDLIWYEAGGDQSTDFNYYTKRTLLAGVYSSTLLYWINDKSKGFVDTQNFLKRRIENVLKLGQSIGKLKAKVTPKD